MNFESEFAKVLGDRNVAAHLSRLASANALGGASRSYRCDDLKAAHRAIEDLFRQKSGRDVIGDRRVDIAVLLVPAGDSATIDPARKTRLHELFKDARAAGAKGAFERQWVAVADAALSTPEMPSFFVAGRHQIRLADLSALLDEIESCFVVHSGEGKPIPFLGSIVVVESD